MGDDGTIDNWRKLPVSAPRAKGFQIVGFLTHAPKGRPESGSIKTAEVSKNWYSAVQCIDGRVYRLGKQGREYT